MKRAVKNNEKQVVLLSRTKSFPLVTFGIGDVVTLNSGGPDLTVQAKTDQGYDCVWVNELGELQQHCFAAAMLQSTLPF